MKTWLLKWVDYALNHKKTTTILGILSAIEAIFFPIPPDVLLAPLATRHPKSWWRLAIFTALTSIAGAIIGYYLGLALYETVAEPLIKIYHVEKEIKVVGEWLQNNATFALLASSFTPIPFKVFTITSGLFKINFPLFILVSLIGRSARFLIVAWVFKKYGQKIGQLLLKYLNYISLAVAIIILYLILR